MRQTGIKHKPNIELTLQEGASGMDIKKGGGF